MPRTLTVCVDTREKYPLLFPEHLKIWPDRRSPKHTLIRLDIQHKALKTGDYLLAKWPTACIVERKASSSELWTNLMTADYSRAESSLTRLSRECRYPVLLLDMTAAEALRRSQYCEEPARALDAFYRLVVHLGLHLLWAGSCRSNAARRALGEQVVRLMFAAAWLGEGKR